MKNTKHQAPSSRETSSTKIQTASVPMVDGWHSVSALPAVSSAWVLKDEPANEPKKLHAFSRNAQTLLDEWRAAVSELRAIVTPDSDGDNDGPNYGTKFAERDYAAIPRRDLPFGAPAFLGDDAWVRARSGGAQNSVARPSPDDGHTLIWHAPEP